ncbi:MAG: hypothetical protein ACI4L8_02020, partial [Candidatus Fimadaptatus sp.]
LLGRRRLPHGCCRSHKRRKDVAAKAARQQKNAEQHAHNMHQRRKNTAALAARQRQNAKQITYL